MKKEISQNRRTWSTLNVITKYPAQWIKQDPPKGISNTEMSEHQEEREDQINVKEIGYIQRIQSPIVSDYSTITYKLEDSWSMTKMKKKYLQCWVVYPAKL